MEPTHLAPAIQTAPPLPTASTYSYSAEVSELEPAATVTELTPTAPRTSPLASASFSPYSYRTRVSNMEPTPEQLSAIRKEDEMFFQRLAELETITNTTEADTSPWLC